MVLSTDSRKIAETIKAPDVSVLIRPAELATDDAKGIDVFIHAVEWIKANHGSFDYFFYLQPTSPLRAPLDLGGGYRLYGAQTNVRKIAYVIAVSNL